MASAVIWNLLAQCPQKIHGYTWLQERLHPGSQIVTKDPMSCHLLPLPSAILFHFWVPHGGSWELGSVPSGWYTGRGDGLITRLGCTVLARERAPLWSCYKSPRIRFFFFKALIEFLDILKSPCRSLEEEGRWSGSGRRDGS